LRLPIVVVNRMNNPNIWNPPHAKVLASEGVPKGWKPDPLYCSDVSVGGWMEASDLSQNIHRWIKSFHHFDSVET